MKRVLVILAMLVFISTVFGEWQVDEGFEAGSIPAEWTVYAGAQGATWSAYENVQYAYGGSWAAFTDSYYPENEENWLILPQADISAGDSLSLYIRSWCGTEIFEILVSVESNAINDFDDELISIDDQDDQYTLYNFDLSEYAGESVYVAIHWMCDTYGLLVDNVKLGQGENNLPEMQLPDSFYFIQGEQLNIDFSGYITNAEPETAVITAAGNQNITIQIAGFNVTLSSLTWNGTEEVTFTLEDNQGNQAEDSVQIIVEAADVFDLQLFSIEIPGVLTCLNEPLYPIAVLSNSGSIDSGDISLEINCQIFDDAATLVYESQQEITLSLAPGEIAPVEFIQSWTADIEGDYTVNFYFDLTDALVANNSLSHTTRAREHFGSGGPDDFGYRWLDNHTAQGPQYNWIDISATGESAIMYNVPSFEGDDNFSEFIPFGFDFNFYGIDYAEFSVDINGEILLADNSWFEAFPSSGWDNDGNVFNWAYPIPGYAQMPALIAVFWDDLQADDGTGDIYFQTFGEAPDRYCVIQWHNLRFHNGENLQDYLSFEAIFYENGEVIMQYDNTATSQAGSNAPHDYGQSATVAIQNEAADMGLTYLQEQVEGSTWMGVEPEGNILTSELAIRFFTGEDVSAPFITHHQKGNTLLSEIELQATISDMSGLSEDHLMYDSGNGWLALEHSSFTEPNIYNYTFTDLLPGTEIHYYFQARDASENANEGTLPANAPENYYSFRVLPYQQNFTLLAYSGSQDYTGNELQAWQEILGSDEIPCDEYNWQEWQDVTIPDQYKAVFLFSNSCSHSDELDSLCTGLMNWLDNGTVNYPKNLFFASDGFAYSQGGHNNASPMKKLFNAYFRTAYVGTTIGGGTNGLGGPGNPQYQDGSFQVWENSPLGFTGDEIEVYANSPDCIFRYEACPSWYEEEVVNPEIGANNAFVFEDGPFNGQAYLYHGVCGTWIDNLIYKAFYFSFDLSQITSANDRFDLIGDCCQWFEIVVENNDNEIAPASAALQQNYPNPFVIDNNRSNNTVISFSCQNAQKAELNVYDIRGRKITSLKKELTPEQKQDSFLWNGCDNRGIKSAAGIYLYQLKIDNRVAGTKKMILLR
ncbi:MAG: choice-of-anchor J domain-containing protein [Candidatus Cloacimonetes bacterium]|nr:choice-of-anchor J domain-containing protein [Candidatus Cloacimonadota bacterium]